MTLTATRLLIELYCPNIERHRLISQSVHELITEILWKYYSSSSFDTNDPVRPQICTCHDSWAVMTCANLWPDLTVIWDVRTIFIFTSFGFWAHKPLVKLVPANTNIEWREFGYSNNAKNSHVDILQMEEYFFEWINYALYMYIDIGRFFVLISKLSYGNWHMKCLYFIFPKAAARKPPLKQH